MKKKGGSATLAVTTLAPIVAPVLLDKIMGGPGGGDGCDPVVMHQAQAQINDLQFKSQTHIDDLTNKLNECKHQLAYTDQKYHEIKNTMIKKELDCNILSQERTDKENLQKLETIRQAELFRARQIKKKKIAENELKNANKNSKQIYGGNKNTDNTIYKIKKGSKKQSCIIGSRAKVFHGICDKTSGGLTKKDLKYNKIGKIVSKKASRSAKKIKNLKKFIAPSNTYSFSKSPKKGSPAYKKIIELSKKQSKKNTTKDKSTVKKTSKKTSRKTSRKTSKKTFRKTSKKTSRKNTK